MTAQEWLALVDCSSWAGVTCQRRFHRCWVRCPCFLQALMLLEASLLRSVCWTFSKVCDHLNIQGCLSELCIGPTDPPEYSWLYGVPAVVFTGAFLGAASTGMAGLVQAGYLTSSVLCIGRSAYQLHFIVLRVCLQRLSCWSVVPSHCAPG